MVGIKWVLAMHSYTHFWRLLLLLLLSRFSHVWLCVTPWTAAHQASPPLGFSRVSPKFAVWAGCWEMKESMLQFLSKGWQPEDPEELMVSYEVWRSPAGEFFLAWGRLVFLFYLGFNWVDEAHPHHGGQAVHAKFTDLSVNHIQNTLQVDI